MDEYERLTEIIGTGAAPQRINALIRRGQWLIGAGRFAQAEQDFDAAIRDAEATPDQKADARNSRAAVYTIARQPQKALSDLEAVFNDPQVSPEIRAKALSNAAIAYQDAGNTRRAIEIYTTAIEDPATEAESRFYKRLARANAMKQAGDPQAAQEFQALLDDPNTPPEIQRSARYFKDKT